MHARSSCTLYHLWDILLSLLLSLIKPDDFRCFFTFWCDKLLHTISAPKCRQDIHFYKHNLLCEEKLRIRFGCSSRDASWLQLCRNRVTCDWWLRRLCLSLWQAFQLLSVKQRITEILNNFDNTETTCSILKQILTNENIQKFIYLTALVEEARHDRLRNKIGVSTINALQQQSASHQLDIYWCRINTYESVLSGMLILNHNSSTLVLTQLPRNALCGRLFPVAAFVRKFMLKKIGFPQWLLLLHTQPLWKPCNPAFNIGYFLSSSLVPLYICCQTLCNPYMWWNWQPYCMI